MVTVDDCSTETNNGLFPFSWPQATFILLCHQPWKVSYSRALPFLPSKIGRYVILLHRSCHCPISSLATGSSVALLPQEHGSVDSAAPQAVWNCLS